MAATHSVEPGQRGPVPAFSVDVQGSGEAASIVTPEFSVRQLWALAMVVFGLDVVLVALTIVFDSFYHVDPPSQGIDTSAAIGWIGVCGAVFAFGSYGILIKTPAVQESNCDCMVWQCYVSFAVATLSMVIWGVASSDGLTLNGGSLAMGLLFATLWCVGQVLSFCAVQNAGYAVGYAIWVGVTICTSFALDVLAFESPVRYPLGAGISLALMVAGVVLAALSSVISDRAGSNTRDAAAPLVKESPRPARSLVFGIACAVTFGLGNGALMVPMTLFHQGLPSLGISAYDGNSLAALAFLPSMSIGIAVVQPIVFLLYWAPALRRGERPQFHFSQVALPAVITGSFWGMGNFCAMFATVYLGQTVGYPLTQLCLIVGGLWGILYFREVRGSAAVATFALASAVVVGGAVLDGLSV